MISSLTTATCYGTRQLDVDLAVSWSSGSCCGLAGSFFCRVSGHLAGGCLGSWRAPPWLLLFLWFLHHDPDLALLIVRQEVSQVSLAQWASPQFENHVQIFTSHLSMMNIQDQVTYEPIGLRAKKKLEGILSMFREKDNIECHSAIYGLAPKRRRHVQRPHSRGCCTCEEIRLQKCEHK